MFKGKKRKQNIFIFCVKMDVKFENEFKVCKKVGRCIKQDERTQAK